MVAFSRPLHRAGMLSRRLMLKAAWGQLVYQMWGASPEKLEKLRESVLALTKGWDQAEISDIVRDTLGDVIEPIVYDEALDRIRAHQRWGHRSSSCRRHRRRWWRPSPSSSASTRPSPPVPSSTSTVATPGAPSATCTPRRRSWPCGRPPTLDGIDLEHCWAYSDSATDIPMLEAVGHPVAVNPDRELARAARERGWQVEQFRLEVSLRDRVPMPAPRQAAVGGGAAVAMGARRRAPGGGGAGRRRRALQLPNLLGCDGGQRHEDDEDEQLLHAAP